MKKLLLTTTALIAASAFAAPAHAGLEVTVGGFTAFQAALYDNDTANNSDRDFQSESQLEIEAHGVADNGLEYGAVIAVEASTSDTGNADVGAVYLRGSWGSFTLGDDGGANDMAVFAPPSALARSTAATTTTCPPPIAATS